MTPGWAPLWKSKPRRLEQAEKDRAKVANWKRVCKAVTKRDGGRCRCCGKYGNHHHHIIYRSHGGADDVKNVVLTCVDCHRDIHDKIVLVTYREPDRAKTIKFKLNTQWD